jgi:hypothetical protein
MNQCKDVFSGRLNTLYYRDSLSLKNGRANWPICSGRASDWHKFSELAQTCRITAAGTVSGTQIKDESIRKRLLGVQD